ncbi:hypothetical protein TWF730_010864 [Orbilia blumenaviensis]|uniref:Uncharacterized protein n=1 Tax=Orbilia blumenaviensis TaxID=1796055 RepID=A0AAV9UIS3_9PEZI
MLDYITSFLRELSVKVVGATKQPPPLPPKDLPGLQCDPPVISAETVDDDDDENDDGQTTELPVNPVETSQVTNGDERGEGNLQDPTMAISEPEATTTTTQQGTDGTVSLPLPPPPLYLSSTFHTGIENLYDIPLDDDSSSSIYFSSSSSISSPAAASLYLSSSSDFGVESDDDDSVNMFANQSLETGGEEEEDEDEKGGEEEGGEEEGEEVADKRVGENPLPPLPQLDGIIDAEPQVQPTMSAVKIKDAEYWNKLLAEQEREAEIRNLQRGCLLQRILCCCC